MNPPKHEKPTFESLNAVQIEESYRRLVNSLETEQDRRFASAELCYQHMIIDIDTWYWEELTKLKEAKARALKHLGGTH